MAKIKFIRLPGLPKTPIGEGQGGGLTPEQANEIAQNTAARHTHQNKNVLDGITAGKVSEWNGKADTADIPSLTGYATETWVQNQGFQTAQDVQTAINGVRQLPAVTASDNGKFLRVVSGAWAAATVPAAENASFGGGS